MAKSRTIVYALIIVMVVSLGFNAYQWNMNFTLIQQKDDLAAQQEMTSLLIQAQSSINAQLEKLDSSLQTACQRLSTTGLTGTQARIVLSDLVGNNSLIVNAATSDINDILVAVEPSEYNSIEGQDISNQAQNVQLHQTMRPAMTQHDTFG